MISTESIYTLHEHLRLIILNRGRRLLPDDQQTWFAKNSNFYKMKVIRKRGAIKIVSKQVQNLTQKGEEHGEKNNGFVAICFKKYLENLFFGFL